MKYVNLNKHALNILIGGQVVEIPASGQLALVEERYEAVETELDGVGVVRRVRGAVQGVPEPTSGVIYLVNGLVLEAMTGSGRSDVYAPDTGPTAVRVADGPRKGQIEHVVRLIACA